MQIYNTESIRNLALLSHSGAGKTALSEAMLFSSGAINRLGQITEGNTASDHEPEEIERQGSIQTTIVPCEWQGKKINVLDTPGYADFAGEVVSALEAVDCGVVLVSAVDGVEVGTEATWLRAEGLGLPRIVVINKLDRENADFLQSLETIQGKFGRRCIPVQLPKGTGAFEGVVDLLDPSASDQHPRFAEFHEALVEAAAEAEDSLTEKYLEEGDLSQEELVQGLKIGIAVGSLFPVLATSATQEVGITQLLDFIAEYAPSPLDRPATEAKNASGDSVQITPGDDAPLAVKVFKTTADPYVGKLSFLRVVGAPLKSDTQVWNVNKGQTERVAQLFVPRGKVQDGVPSLASGDIGAVAKLQHTGTGDTLVQKDKTVTFPKFEFPSPVHSIAISPKTKTDMDKMGTSLTRLIEEDPSLQVTRDQAISETVLSGLGEAHVDVACKKMKRKFQVDVLTATPSIPYRETIKTKIRTEYKHKKQSGGHGQYAHVYLELEPTPRGSGVEFGNKVVGGSVPKEYIPAVEKGVMEAAHQGVISGNPVVDVKVTLVDGSSHSVDSSNMAFQIAGSQALKKGLQDGASVLLEPIMRVGVTVPDTYTGDIMGDLNGKRGRVSGTTPHNGATLVEAHVPLSEMQRYATDLRSMTQGRGSYTMDFSRYEEVPANLAQKVAEETKQHASS